MHPALKNKTEGLALETKPCRPPRRPGTVRPEPRGGERRRRHQKTHLTNPEMPHLVLPQVECSVTGQPMSAQAIQPEFAGFPVSTQGEAIEGPVGLYFRLSAECGGLVPTAMLPAALGVSQQRVSQLVRGNRFEVHKIGTLTFVTGNSLEVFLKEERASGSYRAPKFSTLLHSVKEVVREHRSARST